MPVTATEPHSAWLARHGLPLLAAVLGAGSLLVLWSASLRIQVRRRTRELAAARDVLSSTIEAMPDP
jgi:hypothetical protein